MNNNHLFQLQKYNSDGSTKHTCPKCGTPKKFVRYVNIQTNQILDENVGRCDREDSCKYHYPPAEYFKANPKALQEINHGSQRHSYSHTEIKKNTEVKFIENTLLDQSLDRVNESHLFIFLSQKFSRTKVSNIVAEYQVGRSGNWDIHDPNSTLFWQIDTEGHVRQCKCIRYDENTGKRKKGEGDCFFLGKRMNSASGEFEQTFFGAHLLSRYPDKKVGIVESEKTALVLAIEHPQFLWLATGGVHGCKWTQEKVYSVLEGRTVVFFPDLGKAGAWIEKVAKIRLTTAKLRVSTIMEGLATDDQIENGLDLADVILSSPPESSE